MIIGREYDMNAIVTIQQNEWSGYVTEQGAELGQLPIELADDFNYYKKVFKRLLYSHGDKNFKKLSEDKKDEAVNIVGDKFTSAMYYAMLKGHQNAFEVLLKESTKFPNLDEDFFRNPHSKTDVIFLIDAKTDDDVFEKNIDQDDVHQLVTYVRRQFDDMYDYIISYSKLFYQRGEELAFEQIRRDIVEVDYDTPLISSMTHAPLNRPFRVTPAFLARFKFEAPYVEQWDIVWDETYGRAYYANLIASLCINQFTAAQIKNYAEGGAMAYQMFLDSKDLSQFRDDEMLYFVDMTYTLVDPKSMPREIYQFEHEYIREYLMATLIKMIGTDANHILLAL